MTRTSPDSLSDTGQSRLDPPLEPLLSESTRPVSPSDDAQIQTSPTLFPSKGFSALPSRPFSERFINNDSNGAYTALNTPTGQLEAGDSTGEVSNEKARRVMLYDRMDSWVELVKAGTIKFSITIMFGSLLCVCLKAWEGFKTPCALSDYEVRIFNALTIAISICLGLNLLASLKRYAIILRWSILTKNPVSVEAFDLILGIEELTNVVKLMFLSLPSLRKYSWPGSKRQRSRDKNPGTNHWYAIACAIWLLINIGSQILIALLSLFWPMKPYMCPLTKYGDVAVADLSQWIYKAGEESDPRATAWRFGMDAQSWQPYPIDEDITDLSALPGTPYYQGDGFYEYRFYYRNPDRLYSDYLKSDRSIRSAATCLQYKVDGTIQTKPKNHIRVSSDGEKWSNITIPAWGAGKITYIGMTNQTCGPRCSTIFVLQVSDRDKVNQTAYWRCESTVDRVAQSGLNAVPAINSSDPRIFGTDQFARLAAGAISWSGIFYNGWNDRQYQLYSQGTPWSPDSNLQTPELESIISRFSIGAIAAFDDHGVRQKVHINDQRCDPNSQQLSVEWPYILGIFGAIALIQCGALCSLLAFANRTIVRDASFFSTAMLLRPVLKLVENEPGVMTMSGAEIKDLSKLRYRKIKYDFIQGEEGRREVTVSIWPKVNRESAIRWPSGEYN